MRGGLDSAQVGEGDNESDHAMPAHAEVADIVEEDDARDARLVAWLHQQRADQHVRAPRLVNHGRSKAVVLLAEDL